MRYLAPKRLISRHLKRFYYLRNGIFNEFVRPHKQSALTEKILVPGCIWDWVFGKITLRGSTEPQSGMTMKKESIITTMLYLWSTNNCSGWKGSRSRRPGPVSRKGRNDSPTLQPKLDNDEGFTSIFKATLESIQLCRNVHDMHYSGMVSSIRMILVN